MLQSYVLHGPISGTLCPPRFCSAWYAINIDAIVESVSSKLQNENVPLPVLSSRSSIDNHAATLQGTGKPCQLP